MSAMTLGDVFVFRTNGGRSEEEASREMSSEENEGGGGGVRNDLMQRKNNNSNSSSSSSGGAAVRNDNNGIEWHLLKDGGGSESGGNACSQIQCGYRGDARGGGGFAVLSPHQQSFHFLGPAGAGGGGNGGGWDFARVDNLNRAVNYLQSIGPVVPAASSPGRVDGQQDQLGVDPTRLRLDGQEQLLTDVLRRSSATAEEDEDNFRRGGGEPPAAIGNSTILQRGSSPFSGAAQQQQMFAASHSMQSFIRSPPPSSDQGIRNLFPEKSSSSSTFPTSGGPVRQSHEENRANSSGGRIKVKDEPGLLHPSKKTRLQDFGDGGGPPSPSRPLSLDQIDHGSHHLGLGGSSGAYRRAQSTFDHDHQRGGNSLTTLMDSSSPSSSPYKSLSPSFSPSFSPDHRSTAFSSGTTSSLPSPSSGLSCFPTSAGAGPFLPLKHPAPESGLSIRSPHVDYGNYLMDSNRMQGGGGGGGGPGSFRGELLPSSDESFLDLSHPQSGRGRYVTLGSPLGQTPFNFPSGRRQPSLDSGAGRPTWPARLLNNVPSLSMDAHASPPILPSRRTLRDPDQLDGLPDGREAPRMHSVPEPRGRLLIQKQLTTTDVGSLGRIILPKKEAETHLPHLPDKEGMEMCMLDYEADRTWTMKYRFWPNNKSRMYLLENTGEFAKFHSLQQGDWLYIYRESLARYVLRAKKTAPLHQVTPSSQSVTEASAAAVAAAAEEGRVGCPAGRRTTMNQSPSRTAAATAAPPASAGGGSLGTTSADQHQHPHPHQHQHPHLVRSGSGGTATAPSDRLSLDVVTPPSSSAHQMPAVETEGGAGGGDPVVPNNRRYLHRSHLILDQHPQQQQQQQPPNSNGKRPPFHPPSGRPSPPSPLSKDAAVAVRDHRPDQHHHQHSDHEEVPNELDGGGEFNLEDFPRLIEADDEIMDSFLGHQSQVSVDVRNHHHHHHHHRPHSSAAGDGGGGSAAAAGEGNREGDELGTALHNG